MPFDGASTLRKRRTGPAKRASMPSLPVAAPSGVVARLLPLPLEMADGCRRQLGSVRGDR